MPTLKPRSLWPLLWLLAMPTPALAHGGEDHTHEDSAPPAVTSGDTSQRLADGRVFIPKPLQRQWQLRTTKAAAGTFPRTVELHGRVIADPQAGGRVQTLQSGRIEAGPQGIAVLGQPVKQGETLAWLQAASSTLERGAQQSMLADLGAQEAVLARRAERFKQLEGSVPHKEIEQAGIELQALRQRKAAVASSLGREALKAPVSGVIAASHVTVGQVVDARTVVFEVIDPKRLAVEALAYDPALVDGLESASAALPNGSLQLAFVGLGRSLREQALPALFRVLPGEDGRLPAVAIGRSLKVLAQTRSRQQGVAVPASAIVRNSANETVVWVHAAPEVFSARKVSTLPLDAQRVLVTQGLKGGEQVVTQGATALAQLK